MNALNQTPENFQGYASQEGARFHAEAIRALRNAGFEIAEEKMLIPEVGIEIDARTINRNGIEMLWEFKGSERGGRPGLHRTDTLRKAIANGYLLSRWEGGNLFPPLLVLTSHHPADKPGAPRAIAATVERSVVLEFINSRDYARLLWFYRATEAQLDALING